MEATLTKGIEYIAYIGHKADKINEMYSTFFRYPDDSDAGYYFRAEDISYIGNEGIAIYTNCFSEEELKDDLLTKLLFAI